MKIALVVALALLFMAACSSLPASPSPTPAAPHATVTDFTAPLASTESNALAPRGFMAYGDLGRLGIGCSVEVLKTTDRGAQVKVLNCPQSTDSPPPTGLQGWVAKSALDLK